MANPWLSFSGQDEEEPENPWLTFAQPKIITPEERLRNMQERFPEALPGLAEPGEEQSEPPAYGPAWLRKAGTAALSGMATMGRGAAREGLRLANPVNLALDNPLTEKILPEGASRAIRRVTDPLAPVEEAALGADVSARENLAEASADMNPWLAGAGFWGAEVAGSLADPLEALPGGMLARGARQALSRGGRAAERVAKTPPARPIRYPGGMPEGVGRPDPTDTLTPDFEEFLAGAGWRIDKQFDELAVATPDGKSRTFRGPGRKDDAARWIDQENDRLLADDHLAESIDDQLERQTTTGRTAQEQSEVVYEYRQNPRAYVTMKDGSRVFVGDLPFEAEGIAELAAASQKIGASLPVAQKAARVVDATPQGAGALRRLRTLDEEGHLIGEMSFTLEPGGGFRVMDVETVGRGTGGMRAMMDKAQAVSGGPYAGSLAETDEGAAALARLRETNPEFFARAPAAEPAGPTVQLSAGERGHVRVPVGAEEGSPTFYRRWFTNWGDYAAMGDDLGPATAEAKRLTGAAIKTEGKRAEMVVRDAALEIKRYQKALKQKGMDRPLDETLEYVLSGLEGEHAFEGAEVLGQRMAAAREHLDGLSRDFEGELAKLIEGDLIKSPEWAQRAKDLRGIIRGNMGQWTRRSFEAFRNADWTDLVKTEGSPERWRWDHFMEWAKREIAQKEPGIAEDVLQARAEGLGNKYLRRDPEVFLGFGERTLIPAERLGSAKARLDLPQQIDDLLGLDKDPMVRYRESVLSLAHDIETLRFKRQLLEQGEGRIFFDQPTGNFSEQVRGATGLDPLAGRYTSPEIHAVIAAATDGARDAASLLAKASALVKWGKTVGSPVVTHPRNLFSWIPMITANGHTIKAWNPRRWARAATTVASGKIAKGGVMERALNAVAGNIQLADGRRLSEVQDYSKLDALRDRLLRLQRAGVIGESTTAGDVAHYRGVAGQVKSLNAFKGTRLAKGASKTTRALEWMYGAEDDLGKLVAFDATFEDLRWAMQGTDEPSVFAEAARRIRDTTPTYSKIAPVTRKLRDSPILSAFPTFTQEVYRNFKNGAKLALGDLRSDNPRMRLLGAKRLGGLVTAAGAPAALAAAGAYATGISEKGVEALREFVAPWDRNSRLAPVSVAGYELQVVNLSYMMPHSIFSEPLIAAALQLAQGEGPVEDVVEATLGAAWEAAEPFLSREILVDGVLDFAWKTRGEFWDARKPADVNARAIANALWRTATPGGLLWIERVAKASGFGEMLEEKAEGMEEGGAPKAVTEFVASLLQQVSDYGKEYRVGEELLAGGSGIRPMTYDVYEGLGFKVRAFKRNYSDASYRHNKAKNHPGRLPPAVVLERRREANEQFRKGWLELHRAVEAMRVIGEESGKPRGIVDRDIRRKLKEEEVGERWIRSVMRGAYEDPY